MTADITEFETKKEKFNHKNAIEQFASNTMRDHEIEHVWTLFSVAAVAGKFEQQSWKLREMSQYSLPLPLAKRTCVSVRLCCLQTLEIKRIGREDTSPIGTRVNKFGR